MPRTFAHPELGQDTLGLDRVWYICAARRMYSHFGSRNVDMNTHEENAPSHTLHVLDHILDRAPRRQRDAEHDAVLRQPPHPLELAFRILERFDVRHALRRLHRPHEYHHPACDHRLHRLRASLGCFWT